MAEAGEQKKKLHCVAYTLYYMILFFAYWFGASRFDVDGDGDFDPEDVEAWLEDRGLVHKNYQRSASKLGRSKSNLNRSGSKLGGKSTTNLGDGQTILSSAPKADSSEKKDLEQQDAEKKDDASPAEAKPKPHGHGIGHWLDRDGDGDVDLFDLVETKVDGECEEDLAMRNLVTGQVKPWFIIIECSVCFFLWLIFSIVNGGGDFTTQKAGLDSLFETETDLRFYGSECQDYRPQVWRWLTYQFTHVGVVHVVMNVFLNIMLGLPLEGAQGHWRMLVMFNAGVFGGACANMLLDGHSVVVGCSGGCYSLIGIHIADLMMNWHQKKFRVPTLVLILLMIGVDLGMNMAASHDEDNVSHAAHIGGGAAGLLVGIIVGNNMKMMVWEKGFIAFAGLLSVGLTIFSLVWLFTQSSGPQSLFEDAGWCWTQQVANQSFPEAKVYCIKCGTEACIAHFQNVALKASVMYSACEELGWWNHGF